MSLVDFLNFRTMVTPSILLAFYYLGALGMPLAVWMLVQRFRRKEKDGESSRSGVWYGTSGWRVRVLFLIFFLMGELSWRIFIEFFIAYFQIRAALVG